MPTPEHIIEKQLYNLADRLERVQVNESEIDKYLPGVRKKLEWLSEEDLLKRVLSLEFNRLLNYYSNMPDLDLNASEKEGKKGKRDKFEKDRRDADAGYERLMINVGKAQGFFPGNLMEMVNKNVAGSKPDIGRIDLMPNYTLFDVRKADARKVLEGLRNVDFFGIRIRPEIASDKDYNKILDKGRKGKKDSHSSKSKKDRGVVKDKKGKEKSKKSKDSGKKKVKKIKEPEYNGNYEIFYKKKK